MRMETVLLISYPEHVSSTEFRFSRKKKIVDGFGNHLMVKPARRSSTSLQIEDGAFSTPSWYHHFVLDLITAFFVRRYGSALTVQT